MKSDNGITSHFDTIGSASWTDRRTIRRMDISMVASIALCIARYAVISIDVSFQVAYSNIH